jgi:hypothetical protein
MNLNFLRMLSSKHRQPQTFTFTFNTSQNKRTHWLNGHFITHAYQLIQPLSWIPYPTSKPERRSKSLYNCTTKSCGFPTFTLWCSFIAITSMYSHRRQYNGTDCNVIIITVHETISNQHTKKSRRCISKWNKYMQIQKYLSEAAYYSLVPSSGIQIKHQQRLMFIRRHT